MLRFNRNLSSENYYKRSLYYVSQVHNSTFCQKLVWRILGYTLIIAVNVVLQVRTHCCVLTGICPEKITIIADDCCINASFLQEPIRGFSTSTQWFDRKLSGENYNMISVNVNPQVRAQWCGLTGFCLPGRITIIADDCHQVHNPAFW